MSNDKNVFNLNNGFTDLWASVLAPLNTDFSININKYVVHVKTLLSNGSQGVCVFVQYGEGPSFNTVERKAVLGQLIKEQIPAKSILVCTTAASINETTELTQHAVAHKVHGCLMGAPFYYAKSSNQGLINSYAHVINSVSSKDWFIYLHSNPFVSSGSLPHAVITELLRMFPNHISGILDASENLTTTSELVRSFFANCMVYTQYEKDILKIMELKSTGSVSIIANLLPKPVNKAITKRSVVHSSMTTDLFDFVVGHHPRVPACKAILSLLQHNPQWLIVRPPMVTLGKEAIADISKNLKKFALDHEMKLP